tara:strand:+ start:495 stop:1688 length:1194 start_codon:yes stop_codon:yes gene_type:complete
MYSIASTKTNKIVHGDIIFVDIERDKPLKECEEYEKKINSQKKEIDYYTTNGLKKIYEEARSFEFPEEKMLNVNKGGLKMYDIIKEFPELGQHKIFFDICGGPGGWTRVLLQLGMSGHGITIMSETCKMWYGELENNEKFNILHSENNDITKTNVMEYCISKVKDVSLVVADGAPSLAPGDESKQEALACKILYSEVYIALNVLNTGGDFVFKIFDTFRSYTHVLIYILSVVFKKVYIYKPPNSRIVNSEKYVVCLHKYAKSSSVLPLFRELFANWVDKSVPENIIPLHIISIDNKFKSHLYNFIKEYTEKQHEALLKVMHTLNNMLYPQASDGKSKDKNGKREMGKGKGKSKNKFHSCQEDGKGWQTHGYGKGINQRNQMYYGKPYHDKGKFGKYI